MIKKLLAYALAGALVFGSAVLPASAEYNSDNNVWIDSEGNENRIYYISEDRYSGGSVWDTGETWTDEHIHTIVYTKNADCFSNGFDIIRCELIDKAPGSETFGDVKSTTYYWQWNDSVGHSFDEKVVPPTYDEEGYTEYTCTKCGFSYKDNIVDKLDKKDDPTGVEVIRQIDKVSVSIFPEICTYNGKEQKPIVTVKDNGTLLKEGTHYKVMYKNNINTGTATVTVSGMGGYGGYVDIPFTIDAVTLGSKNVSLAKSSYTYTGSNIKPEAVVKVGNTSLKSGKDYTVSYKNNKAVGTATVIIIGKGNYKGTVKSTFKICPKKTTLKTVKSPKTKQLKATYTKVAGVTGYQITYSTSSKFTKATTKSVNASGTSKTVSKLKKGKTYYVKVRTYKTVNGTKYYSGYSAVKKIKVK